MEGNGAKREGSTLQRGSGFGLGAAAGALERLFSSGSLTGLTDAELLERFTAWEESNGIGNATAEAAFSALVERHGPLVFGICRRVLGDRHDSEDAFQATFLVLARKARSIRRGDAVSGWLYEVARRIALRTRHQVNRRRHNERRLQAETHFDALIARPSASPWTELYEELDRVPEPFRSAIVLCDLEGHPYDRAAALLGCPIGTLQSRLARGRRRLRARLERRGIVPAAVLMGSGSAIEGATISVPASLVTAVVRSAIGEATMRNLGIVSATVAALVSSELKRHFVARSLVFASALMTTGFVLMGAASFARSGAETQPAEPKAEPPKAQAPAPTPKPKPTPVPNPAAQPRPNPGLPGGPVHIRVVDEQGKAVPNAEVQAIGKDGKELPSFKTDEKGLAIIPRVEVGLVLRFVRQNDNTVGWLNAFPFLSIRSESIGTEKNPAIIKLTPLNHRVNGSVVDPEGKPVAGISVRPTALGSLDEFRDYFDPVEIPAELIKPALSDEAGRFSIMLPTGAAAILNANDPQWIGAGAVVKPGSQTMSPNVLVLKPLGEIAGHVIDEATDQPISGMHVEAYPVERHNLFNEAYADWKRHDLEPDVANLVLALEDGRARTLLSTRSATTDTKGRFAINRLSSGVYTVRLASELGPKLTAAAVEGVRVRPLGEATAELNVTQGARLYGEVIDGETGRPIVGAEVGCRSPAAPPEIGDCPVQKTDRDGRFLFYIPPGLNFLELRDAGKFSRLGRRTVLVPRQGYDKPVRLVRLVRTVNGFRRFQKPSAFPDEELIAANARTRVDSAKKQLDHLLKTAIDSNKPGHVRTLIGHVRDSNGAPVVGVRLAPLGSLDSGKDFDTAVSDHNGKFLFTRLPDSQLPIFLSRPETTPQQYWVTNGHRPTAEITFNPKPESLLDQQPQPPSDDVMPLVTRDRLTFVDIIQKSTDLLADGPGGNGDDLNRLRRGVRKLGDIYFRIGEGMIRLDPHGTHALPQKVEGIAVGARANRLHWLHATQADAPSGTEVLAYEVHYADGSTERIPIVSGRDIAGWRNLPESQAAPTEARVAWSGSNDRLEDPGPFGVQSQRIDSRGFFGIGLKSASIRLIAKTWTNPHPEKPIASITMRLADNAKVNPFLVALTLERDE